MSGIGPGLVRNAILEPSIRAPNGNIEDQVERLVKGRVGSPGLHPWVCQQRVVHCLALEIASLEHVGAFGKSPIHHLLQGVVDPREEIILRPLHSEGVETLAEIGATEGFAARRTPVCVGVRIGSCQ